VATAAARRYASAVFDLATTEGRVDEWRRQLATITDLMDDPALSQVLRNPTISASRRMELITEVGHLDPEASNLARMLVETGRVGEADGILQEFDDMADEAAGRVRARVTTAVELSAEDRERIGRGLSKRLGKEVRITATVDRRIVGGLKLQYGDHLIDVSVATRLQQLRRRLADAS
jgi:F-type H+-transporting ATPase subunit delta